MSLTNDFTDATEAATVHAGAHNDVANLLNDPLRLLPTGGTDGQVLTIVAGVPTWVTPA